MHEAEGARLGLRLLVLADRFRWARPAGERSLRELVLAPRRGRGFAGLNVTHPFKQSVIPLSRRALARGRGDRRGQHGRLRATAAVGHNTDCWGFAESFRRGMQPARLSTASSCSAPAARAWRSPMRSSTLARRSSRSSTSIRQARDDLAAEPQCRPGAASRRRRARPSKRQRACADGLVNATPVGMAKYPGMPVPASCAPAGPLGRRHRLLPRRDRTASRCRGRRHAAPCRARAWRSSRRSRLSS